MKLIIETQCHENYGFHDWDGTGECPQYWKAKGGSTYHFEGLSFAEAADAPWLKVLVAKATEQVTHKSEAFEEYLIDWHLEEDDYLGEDEQNQLRWDGKIMFPDPRLVLPA